MVLSIGIVLQINLAASSSVRFDVICRLLITKFLGLASAVLPHPIYLFDYYFIFLFVLQQT